MLFLDYFQIFLSLSKLWCIKLEFNLESPDLCHQASILFEKSRHLIIRSKIYLASISFTGQRILSLLQLGLVYSWRVFISSLDLNQISTLYILRILFQIDLSFLNSLARLRQSLVSSGRKRSLVQTCSNIRKRPFLHEFLIQFIFFLWELTDMSIEFFNFFLLSPNDSSRWVCF